MIPVGPFQGRLARDPKFDTVGASATSKWQATIAVDEPRYNAQTRTTEVAPLWVMVQAWGTMAEDLWDMAYAQGDELAITGRLAQFTIGEGDKRDTKTHVVALMVQCTRRKSPKPQGHAQARPAPPPTNDQDPWASAPPAAEPPF